MPVRLRLNFLTLREICNNKQINANQIESLVIEDISKLTKNQNLLDMTIEEINSNLHKRIKPLEKERTTLKKRLQNIETEISHYVKALGKGKLSIERLEQEIHSREKDKAALQFQLDEINRQINDEIAEDFDAEVVRNSLKDFDKIFESLTPDERSEALQCILQKVTLHPDKVVLNIYELPEFKPGSQNRTEWLPGCDISRTATAFVAALLAC